MRRGPSQVIQVGLDLRGGAPTDTEPLVRPVFETRGLRFWEEFDEGIVRWWIRTTVAAIAGQQVSLQFNPPGQLPAPPYPRGTLLTIDRVRNNGAANGIQLHVSPGVQTAPGFVFPSARDSRWLQGITSPINLPIGTGQAGTSGAIVDEIDPGATTAMFEVDPEWVSPVRGTDQKNVETFELRGITVGSGFSATIYGRLIVRE